MVPAATADHLRMMEMMYWVYGGVAAVALVFFAGIRVVRPTGRGLVERLGKYRRLAMPGVNWVMPLVDRMFLVNITETMVNAEPQEIITNDNLNARVDAQVYFKVKSDEESVKSSQYQVFDYRYQIVVPANTELVNIIGDMAGLLPIGRGGPAPVSQTLHARANDLPSALADAVHHLRHA